MSAFSPPVSVPVQEVLSSTAVSSITRVFGHGPAGHFTPKGTYGYTHFVVDLPTSPQAVRKWTVLCHGLGTNLHVYDALAAALTSDEFHVLRYEFYNHGFSVGCSRNLPLNEEVMVTQVKELLDFVCEEDEKGEVSEVSVNFCFNPPHTRIEPYHLFF